MHILTHHNGMHATSMLPMKHVPNAHAYIENCRQPLRLFCPVWGSSVQCTESLWVAHAHTSDRVSKRIGTHERNPNLTLTLVNTNTLVYVDRYIQMCAHACKVLIQSCWQIFEEWWFLENLLCLPECAYTNTHNSWRSLGQSGTCVTLPLDSFLTAEIGLIKINEFWHS